MPITFEGVSFSYQAPTKKKRRTQNAHKEIPWALRDVTFTIEDGEFVGIVGHTGSGKSTLIQHANGLLQPTEGRVLVHGSDISDKKAAANARWDVGVVFQYPEHQLFAATVAEDVAFGPRNLGLPEEEITQRVKEALAAVHLDVAEIGDASPFELSGGQQRRVAFAGVLAMKPRILVLDEPAAGLDPKSRSEFLALLKELHERKLTIVMVSHSMEELAELATKIVVLKDGQVFSQGTPEEVFAHPVELRAIGLGVPAAQAMALRLRERGINLTRPLYTAETLAEDIAALYHAKG